MFVVFSKMRTTQLTGARTGKIPSHKGLTPKTDEGDYIIQLGISYDTAQEM